MKSNFQEALNEAIANVPHALLEKLVERKFTDAGVDPSEEAVRALAGALIAGDTDFTWDDDNGTPDVTITFTDADLQEFNEAINKFLDEGLPKLFDDVLRRAARGLVKTLKANWPERALWEEQTHAGFEARLAHRWAEALNLLKMLLTISREFGEEAYQKARKSRAKRNRHRTDVLLRLHARACQVTGEIITLMESGYADGAMARWRTLHEIGVVIALIAEHGDDLAERYLAHDIVESARALDVYQKTHAALGYAPPPKRLVKRTEKLFQNAVAKYGPGFETEYGWAAKQLGRKSPRFTHLETAAQQSRMRAHYKMACQNVHAGIKGITSQLSVMHPMILAGPSNAGLEEPGQNAAITLTQITFALLGPRCKFDDVVMMMTLADLQGQAVNAFVRAGRRLQSEEKGKRKKKG